MAEVPQNPAEVKDAEVKDIVKNDDGEMRKPLGRLALNPETLKFETNTMDIEALLNAENAKAKEALDKIVTTDAANNRIDLAGARPVDAKTDTMQKAFLEREIARFEQKQKPDGEADTLVKSIEQSNFADSIAEKMPLYDYRAKATDSVGFGSKETSPNPAAPAPEQVGPTPTSES